MASPVFEYDVSDIIAARDEFQDYALKRIPKAFVRILERVQDSMYNTARINASGLVLHRRTGQLHDAIRKDRVYFRGVLITTSVFVDEGLARYGHVLNRGQPIASRGTGLRVPVGALATPPGKIRENMRIPAGKWIKLRGKRMYVFVYPGTKNIIPLFVLKNSVPQPKTRWWDLAVSKAEAAGERIIKESLKRLRLSVKRSSQ